MSEERLQEIKDSVEFQYKLAKVKCIDNALLFADEERELIEEIERLKEELKYTIPIVEHNKTITKHLKEIKRLHSIIKEVREWANKTVFYFDFEEEINKHAFDLLYTKQGQELLNILDKGE